MLKKNVCQSLYNWSINFLLLYIPFKGKDRQAKTNGMQTDHATQTLILANIYAIWQFIRGPGTGFWKTKGVEYLRSRLLSWSKHVNKIKKPT